MSEDTNEYPITFHDPKEDEKYKIAWEKRHNLKHPTRPQLPKVKEVFEGATSNLKEIPARNKVEIPATGPDRKVITVCKKPFFHTFKGIVEINLEINNNPSQHLDTVCASYLIEVEGKLAFLHLPVFVDKNSDDRFERDILDLIGTPKDGKKRVLQLIQNSKLRKMGTIGDKLHLFHALRIGLKYGKFNATFEDSYEQTVGSGWLSGSLENTNDKTRFLKPNIGISPNRTSWERYERDFFINNSIVSDIALQLHERLNIGDYQDRKVIELFDANNPEHLALQSKLFAANT